MGHGELSKGFKSLVINTIPERTCLLDCKTEKEKAFCMYDTRQVNEDKSSNEGL